MKILLIFGKYVNIENIVKIISVTWILFQFINVHSLRLGPLELRPIFIGFAFSLAYLTTPFYPRLGKTFNWIYNIIFFILIWISVFHIARDSGRWVIFAGNLDTIDYVIAIIIVFAVFDVTRRLVGWAVPIVAMFFVAYALFGNYAPPIIAHRGFSVIKIAQHLALTPEGIFGVPIAATANIMVYFILFGAFLKIIGASDLFNGIALSIFGWMRGGTAKTAVMSSMALGSISGSAVANVAISGAVTIPMMIKAGYRKIVAGAVEAAASTGGQMMPPVMAAVGFIMAELLNIPYIEVIKAAMIPASLYFLSIFFMVDLQAGKMGLKGIPRNQLPKLLNVLSQGWHLLIPIIVLLILMIYFRYSPGLSAIWSIYASILCTVFKRNAWIGFSGILRTIYEGSKSLLPISAVCACAGIIIGMVILTGLGHRISTILIDIAGNNLFLLLSLTTIICIVLGMGMATTATYILVSILVAPALEQMGIPRISSHMFVLYFGVIAAVTPPVAVAAYAAASLTNTNPMTTGFYAMRFAIAGYIVPFMFIYGPGLLLLTNFWDTIHTTSTALVGIYCLASAIEGYLFKNCNIIERILLAIAAITLMFHGNYTDVVGISILIIIIVSQRGKFYLDKFRKP